MPRVTTLVPLCLGWMSSDASMMAPDESGPMRFPIPGYAVVHERGTVLFDTGLHEPLMTRPTSSACWPSCTPPS